MGWQWLNEDPDRWSISNEGWLVIQAANPPFGKGIVNLLTRPLPPERDVIVTTRVRANPAENFKQAALYFVNDELSYISVVIGFCQPCLPEAGGYGIFVEATNQGESMLPGPVWYPRQESDTEVTLRLEYSPEAAVVVGLYAYEPDNWQRAFLLRDVPVFTMTGIGASNLPGPEGSSADLRAEYDFFEFETP